MFRIRNNIHKLIYLIISFSIFLSMANASIVYAQNRQKSSGDDYLHFLFLSVKQGKMVKETLITNVNGLANESFEQKYKANVRNIELEGIYDLGPKCLVTCHTAELISGENVFLFHAHVFSKFNKNDIQIHGRGKEDLLEFERFMIMSESGKIKFIRYYFETYAKVELPSE